MVKQLAEGSRTIQNLNWEILHRQTRRGRDLTDEEVEEKKQERARHVEQREKVKQAAARKRKLEGTIVSQSERVMEHTTRESDRVIETVTQNVRAEFAASSRETLMERIAGPRGSSQETQLAINVLKEDQKKQRKAETAERKAEEKQKNKERMLAIPLGEGDSLQDGVVLRGEVAASKLRRFQGDAEIRLGAVCCRLVELGELATLQLKPLDKQQMTALAALVESAGSVGMTIQIQAVTEKGVLKAEIVKGKLRDSATDKVIALSALLALRFIPSTFKLADRLPLRRAPLEPLWEQPVELAKEDLPDQPVEPLTDREEPTAIQDRAQDLLSSGKEVWAATVSGRTVLFQYVKNAIWGARQPDILATLINPQDVDVVAAWSQDRRLPRILLREQEEIYVSAQFLQAHCTKLRCKQAAEEEQAEAAQPAEDVEMPDAKPEEAEDKPAEAAPAAQPVLFRQIRRRPSAFQPAPELSVKLINPERDEELVRVWCKAGRFPKIHVSSWLGQFCLHPEFVHAYCWELSWDSVAGQRHAEDAKPAEDKPAEEADDKPAELQAEAADAPAPEDDVETLHGLKVRKVEGDWYELAARTLDEFEVAEKILRDRLKDKTFAEFKMKRPDKGSTSEVFEVRWDTGKLWLPKCRRSVLAEEAKARVPQHFAVPSVQLLRFKSVLDMLTEECWEIVISFLYPLCFLRQPEPTAESCAIVDALVDPSSSFFHHQIFEDAAFLGGMHRVSRSFSGLVGDMTVLRSNLSRLHRNFFQKYWDLYHEQNWTDPELADEINVMVANQEQSHKFERQVLYALTYEATFHRDWEDYDQLFGPGGWLRWHFARKPLVMMEHHHATEGSHGSDFGEAADCRSESSDS
ncbi:unnamed protein product [Symbiodinium sp. KB8]|nr:unnamed protein product [Symbiodinium sp. KB8]